MTKDEIMDLINRSLFAEIGYTDEEGRQNIRKTFCVWHKGLGGHLKGEVILIDYGMKVAFTGDVYVNIHGMTAEQAEYNKYAPILMTSVDTDPSLCKRERDALIQRLGAGKWSIFSGHGAVKTYDVAAQKQ